MRDEGITPAMPDNPAPYLTTWLFEIGPSVVSGMGEVPLDWQHLRAWQDMIGVSLLPWEARIIRQLSGDFVGQRQKARKADCPAPYTGDAEQVRANRAIVSEKVSSLFAGLVKRPASGR